jgi:hypothetical protein
VELTTVVTVAVSVVLALAGYLATYAYDLRLARRKDQLERVNEQLSDFYGPLLALVDAGRASWRGFRTLYRPGGVAGLSKSSLSTLICSMNQRCRNLSLTRVRTWLPTALS